MLEGQFEAVKRQLDAVLRNEDGSDLYVPILYANGAKLHYAPDDRLMVQHTMTGYDTDASLETVVEEYRDWMDDDEIPGDDIAIRAMEKMGYWLDELDEDGTLEKY